MTDTSTVDTSTKPTTVDTSTKPTAVPVSVQQTPTPASLTTTAAVSMAAVSGVSIVKWVFACLAAHALVTPDDATATIMAGIIAPAIHSLQRFIAAIMKWLLAKRGIVLD